MGLRISGKITELLENYPELKNELELRDELSKPRIKLTDEYLPEYSTPDTPEKFDMNPLPSIMTGVSRLGNAVSVPLAYATSQVYTGDTKAARESEGSKNFLEQIRSIENPFAADSIESSVRKLGEGLTKVGKSMDKPMPTSEAYLKELEKSPEKMNDLAKSIITNRGSPLAGLSALGSSIADAYKNTDSELGKSAIAMGSDLFFDPLNIVEPELLGPALAVGQTKAVKYAKDLIEKNKEKLIAEGITTPEAFEKYKEIQGNAQGKLWNLDASTRKKMNDPSLDRPVTEDSVHLKNLPIIKEFNKGLDEARAVIGDLTFDDVKKDPNLAKKVEQYIEPEMRKRLTGYFYNGNDKILEQMKTYIQPLGFEKLGSGAFQTAFKKTGTNDVIKVDNMFFDIRTSDLGNTKTEIKQRLREQAKVNVGGKKNLTPNMNTYGTERSTYQIQPLLSPVKQHPGYVDKVQFREEYLNPIATEFNNEQKKVFTDLGWGVTDVKDANFGLLPDNTPVMLDVNADNSNIKINDISVLEDLLNNFKVSTKMEPDTKLALKELMTTPELYQNARAANNKNIVNKLDPITSADYAPKRNGYSDKSTPVVSKKLDEMNNFRKDGIEIIEDEKRIKPISNTESDFDSIKERLKDGYYTKYGDKFILDNNTILNNVTRQRAPDESEVQYWMDKIRAGGDDIAATIIVYSDNRRLRLKGIDLDIAEAYRRLGKNGNYKFGFINKDPRPEITSVNRMGKTPSPDALGLTNNKKIDNLIQTIAAKDPLKGKIVQDFLVNNPNYNFTTEVIGDKRIIKLNGEILTDGDKNKITDAELLEIAINHLIDAPLESGELKAFGLPEKSKKPDTFMKEYLELRSKNRKKWEP